MNIIYITAVHMSGGDKHEHITEVRYTSNGQTRTSSTADMVNWLKQAGNEARVHDALAPGYVKVGVVNGPRPYLRTYRDNTPTDNLLYLPRY